MTIHHFLTSSPKRTANSREAIQRCYSIDFSLGDDDDDALMMGDVDMDDDELGKLNNEEENEANSKRENQLTSDTKSTTRYYHSLYARSMSPRPSLAASAPIRSAASSPGGLQYPLQQKLRHLSRAQRQELLKRTGAPIPISPSNSLEDNDVLSQSSSPCSRQLTNTVHALRRDSSILDRALNDGLAVPTQKPRLGHSCCSSEELDQAIIKTPTLVHQSTVGSIHSSALSQATKTNHVLLHIYDLIAPDTLMQLPFGCMCEIGKCFKELNDGLHLMGTGVYHVGVEVNGIEYAFGACATPGRSGVFPCTPKQSPGYQYRTTIDFGERAVVRRSNVVVLQHDHSVEFEDDVEYLDGRDIVRGMAKEYMGSDYNILRRNCCTFARDVCFRLGVKQEEIPSWFSNLAESGAITQDIAMATVQPLRVFSICETDTGVREGYEVRMSNCGVPCT
jgi:hypothetical protein